MAALITSGGGNVEVIMTADESAQPLDDADVLEAARDNDCRQLPCSRSRSLS